MSRILLLTFFFLLSAWADDPRPPAPPLPPGWEEAIGKSFYYNTGQWMPQGDPIFTRVLHWDIPEEEARAYRAKYLPGAPEESLVSFEKEGRPYVRLFAHEPEVPSSPGSKLTIQEELILRLRERFGPPVEPTYWGVKILSHNTYFVWNPSTPAEQPFYAKFQLLYRYAGESAIQSQNGEAEAKLSLDISDWVETTLREDPRRPDSALPERFALSVDLPASEDTRVADKFSRSYTYSIRSAQPIGKPIGENVTQYAVHTLLGKKSSQWGSYSLAKAEVLAPYLAVWKGGSGAEEWLMKEYVPKLARFLVAFQFRDGIFPPAHTQNLLIRINRTNGEIEGFDFRDMKDSIVDPMARVSAKKKLPQLPDRGMWLNWTHKLRPESPRTMFAGGNLYSYAYASIESLLGGGENTLKVRAAEHFLNLYLAETARETGLPLEISQKTLKARERLRKNPNAAGLMDPAYEGFAGTGQEIHDQVSRARAEELAETTIPAKQDVLWRVFEEQIPSSSVGWFLPDSRKKYAGIRSLRSRLTFSYNGQGILVVDQKSGDPVAYAFNLNQRQRMLISESDPAVAPTWADCAMWALKRAGRKP